MTDAADWMSKIPQDPNAPPLTRADFEYFMEATKFGASLQEIGQKVWDAMKALNDGKAATWEIPIWTTNREFKYDFKITITPQAKVREG